jgi:hypothetical protein
MQGEFMSSEPIFDNVMHRLKSVLRLENDKDLASRLDLSPSSFANRKGTKSLPYEPIVRLAKSENLNLDWIFRGVGEPYANPAPEGALAFDLVGVEIDAKLLGLIFVHVFEQFTLFERKTKGSRLEELIERIDASTRADEGASSCEEKEAEFLKLVAEATDERRERQFHVALIVAMIYNEMVRRKIKTTGPNFEKFLKDQTRQMVQLVSLVKEEKKGREEGQNGDSGASAS